MNTLAPFSVFYCGRNCNKTKSRVGLKRKRKGILLPPVTHHLKAATSSSQGSGNGEERIKERGRGGSAGESKYCCDSLIKVKGLSWVQTADLGLYCSPSYMRKFLKFVLSSCYWSSEGFFFFPGKIRKTHTHSSTLHPDHLLLGRLALMSTDYSRGFLSKWGEIIALRETGLSEVTARVPATSFFCAASLC